MAEGHDSAGRAAHGSWAGLDAQHELLPDGLVVALVAPPDVDDVNTDPVQPLPKLPRVALHSEEPHLSSYATHPTHDHRWIRV